jgi:CheY-specific phosphatase CheX
MIEDSSIPATSQVFETMNAQLRTATLELFGGYDLPLQEAPQSNSIGSYAPSQIIAATIGYSAEMLRGALVLASSLQSVQLWQSALMDPDPSDDAIRDTIGEFANMLLGRTKNLLLAHGLVLMGATPTTIVGDRFTFPVPRAGQFAWHRFTGDAGPVDVRLDAMFDQGFVLRPRPNHPPASEGDTMLF